jgi:hypothetical protein
LRIDRSKVIHGVKAFGTVVEAIGDRRGGRLVEQSQHVQTGQPRGVLGGLALRFVEIGRHGDHGTHQIVAERVFRELTQRRENLRRYFDRALHAVDGANLHHARRVDEIVRRVFGPFHFRLAAAHEALDRDDRVTRIARRFGLGGASNTAAALLQIADHRRQQHMAVRVGQHFGHAAAHRCDEGVGRAEIDTDRETPLMRRRRHAGFGDLQ